MFKVLLVLSYFSLLGCGIWSIVEFILYLFEKTQSFNWDSLWCIGISLVGVIIFLVLSLLGDARKYENFFK